VTAAIGSALSPSFWVLIGFRLLLGFSAGGDYLVSAVLMSEYANRKDRGKLVGMVFGTQAPGLIVGPLAALALLGARARNDVTGHADAQRGARRRGDLPTPQDARIAAVLHPGPRAGRAGGQAAYLVHRRAGQRPGSRRPGAVMGLRAFLTSRRWILLAGTACTWFLLDYACCGNTISTPQILGLISLHASSTAKVALQLAIFVVAAVPW
jgi:MFS transporter, PHS family, inorganic phosphate transporter